MGLELVGLVVKVGESSGIGVSILNLSIQPGPNLTAARGRAYYGVIQEVLLRGKRVTGLWWYGEEVIGLGRCVIGVVHDNGSDIDG